MTPTEKARRSDALYYETVSVTRRVLCDAIANREADLEDARAENARLRESVRRLMTQRDERLAVAETENTKLRELVRDLWEYIYIGTAQDGQSLHDRTHELGVGVDGWA